MTRWVLSTAAVAGMVVLLWAGFSFWAGIRAEEIYYSTLSELYTYPFMDIASQGYDRGLFSSHSTTRLTFPGGSSTDAQDSGLTFIIHQDIDHGPFAPKATGITPVLAVMRTRLSLAPETQVLAREELGREIDLSTVSQQTVFDFSGGGAYRLSVPPSGQAASQGEHRFVWQGLELSGTFQDNGQAFEGTLNASSLDLVWAQGRAAFQGLSVHFDLEQDRPLLYLGTTRFDLDSLSMSNPVTAPGGFTLEGFRARNDSVEENGLVRVASSVSFDWLHVGNATYGPLLLEQEAANLDAGALAALQRAGQQASLAATAPADEQALAAVAGAYLEALPGLLAASPEVHIKRLIFKTPQGEIQATGSIRFNGKSPYSLEMPLSLLSALSIETSMTLPREVLLAMLRPKAEPGRAEAALERLIDLEIFMSRQDGLHLDLVYSNNLITLNGRQTTPMELMSRIAAASGE